MVSQDSLVFKLSDLKKDIIFSAKLRGRDFTFQSTWGIFSQTEIDEVTKLLLEYVEIPAGISSILDLGCGYGALGIPLAALAPQAEVHLIDKDFVAVEFAKKNAELNGAKNCKTYLSNMFSNVPDRKFDCIVSNLPAKVGKELLRITLSDAKEHLTKGGSLYVVTISGLKEFIKRNLTEVFGNYEKVKQGRTYTVALARRE